MKRISLSFTFLFAFACVVGAACAGDPAVMCDITWEDANGMQVGTGTLTYDGLDDADAGVDMCGEDQATHEERPSDATSYQCNCST